MGSAPAVSRADEEFVAQRGGDFAAWEEPELFSEELRAAYASVR
jgi:hypothetical protein